MKSNVLLVGCLLPLAACDSGPKVDERNASVAEVAEKVRKEGAEQSFINPGLWQSKVTIEQFDVPGMPAEMVQRMKTMMAENQEHDFQTCLTTDQVKRPKEDFFAGKNNECRYDRFTMGNGRIDAVMRCGDGKGGASQVMQMAGSYSPNNYAMQMSTKVDAGAGEQGGMSMRMRVEANRIGECTGKESQG